MSDFQTAIVIGSIVSGFLLIFVIYFCAAWIITRGRIQAQIDRGDKFRRQHYDLLETTTDQTQSLKDSTDIHNAKLESQRKQIDDLQTQIAAMRDAFDKVAGVMHGDESTLEEETLADEMEELMSSSSKGSGSISPPVTEVTTPKLNDIVKGAIAKAMKEISKGE